MRMFARSIVKFSGACFGYFTAKSSYNMVVHASNHEYAARTTPSKEVLPQQDMDDYIEKYPTRFPSDLIHALLSAHVYTDPTEGEQHVAQFPIGDTTEKYNQYLTEWIVNTVFDQYNNPQYGYYYGVHYNNHHTKQSVLAHKGSSISDLIQEWDGKENMAYYISKQLVKQQVASYCVTKEVCKQAKENGYHLSFTGYSTGGLLAEISAYFAYKDFEYNVSKQETRCVSFETPGQIVSNDPQIKHICYLSKPNFFNSCYPHISSFYTTDNLYTLPFTSSMLHSHVDNLKQMLSIFASQTDSHDNYRLVQKWPLVIYNTDGKERIIDDVKDELFAFHNMSNYLRNAIFQTMKNFKDLNVLQKLFISSVEQSLLMKPLNHEDEENIQNAIGDLDKLHAGIFISIGKLYQAIYDCTITPAQYNFYQHNFEKDTSFSYSLYLQHSIKPKLNIDCDLSYQTKECNLRHTKLNTLRFIADVYLEILSKCPEEAIGPPFFNEQEAALLLSLKHAYTISDSGLIIPTKKNVSAEQIQDMVLSFDEKITKFLLAENAFCDDRIVFLSEDTPFNLPHLISHFYSIHSGVSFWRYYVDKAYEITQLDQILSQQQYALVTGVQGSGKTFFVDKYIRDKKTQSLYVDCKSEQDIEKVYHRILTYLDVNLKYCKQKVQLIKEFNYCVSKQDEVTLIFDHVTEYETVKPYIENLPENIKCIIISNTPETIPDSIITEAQTITLRHLSNEEATKYFEKIYCHTLSQDTINNVLEIVGTLPVNLATARKVFHDNPCVNNEKCVERISQMFSNDSSTSKQPYLHDILGCAEWLDAY